MAQQTRPHVRGDGRSAPPVPYRYVAKDMEGNTVRGVAEAADQNALYADLKSRGLYLQSASQRGGAAKRDMLKPKMLSEFCRQVATLLAAGVSLTRALEIVCKEDSIPAAQRRIYEAVLAEVRKGADLSVALEDQEVFPPLMLGMVRAGEGTGSLDKVMERLALHFEKRYQMEQQVISALIYPAVLAVLAVAVVIVIVTFVLPQFGDLFSNMDSLPGSTMLLMAFSDFMVSKWYTAVIGLIVCVVAVRMVLRIPDVRLTVDRMKLTMPVFGPLNSVICTARFARTLSSLYASGMPIVNALQIGRDTIDNTYIMIQFDEVLARVRQGEALSASLEPVVGFRRKLSSTIKIGEETGQLDSMLDHIAESMEYDAQQATKRMVTILEPMLIVLMALVLGFIMVAVMSPIIGSYGAIEGSSGL